MYKVGGSGSLAIAVLVLVPKIIRNQTLTDDANKTVHSIFIKPRILVDTLVMSENHNIYKVSGSGSIAIEVLVLVHKLIINKTKLIMPTKLYIQS